MLQDSQEASLARAIETLAEDALGAHVVASVELAPGLGTRRFRRLRLDTAPHTAIARIEAPEDPRSRPTGVDPEPPLEPLRSFLEAHGLPVPRRYGAHPALGIELLEDVGDTTLEQVAQHGPARERRALYAAACELVPVLQALHAEPSEIPAFGRRLDAHLFDYKAGQVVEHLLPRALGRSPSAAQIAVVERAFGEIAEAASAAPQRLAHRDFKAQNLHVVPEQREARRLILIDIQGAFLAPPEYDLVCLLRDLHVLLPEPDVSEHLRAVRALLPDAPTAAEFDRRFTLLTISRVGKDLARFLYAVHIRGDERYRPFLENGARILGAAAARAATWSSGLARLADLLGDLDELGAGWRRGGTKCGA